MNLILTTTEEVIYFTKVYYIWCYLLDPVFTYQVKCRERFRRLDFWSKILKTEIAITPEGYLTQFWTWDST